MSTLYVDSIQPKTTGGNVTITNQANAGKVLQVKYFQLTTSQVETYSTTNTDQAITNFTVNITPKSTSSIIKIESNVMYESANPTWDTMWFFYRDSIKLGNTDSSPNLRKTGISSGLISHYASENGTTPEASQMTYYDAPSSTSEISYKLGVNSNGTNPFYINRTINNNDAQTVSLGVSFISVMEIGG